MSEAVDDRIECLECGSWFRSVANHVYPAHGLLADEYRLRHDLPTTDPLSGTDTSRRRREAARHRLESDPGLLDRMLSRGKEAAEMRAGEPSQGSEARTAAMARRHRVVDAQWQERLARQGWSSWQEAADWAIDENVGWAEVAALFGRSETSVQVRAQLAGAPRLDRRITARQRQMLKLAQERFAEAGTLSRAAPHELSLWLSTQRRQVARGLRRRVHAHLDEIDPDWTVTSSHRTNPPCARPGCLTPRVAGGLCQVHYNREMQRQRRDAVVDPADQVECLECGDRFRSVGTHVTQAHGLSAAEYRARHSVADAASMNTPAVRAKRQRDTSTPEARERFRTTQYARWGGTPAELWARRFERAGWSGWADAVAWVMEHNVGWIEIADRLGCSKNTARRGASGAGVVILPPMTRQQLEFLELARLHASRHGDLARPEPVELARWIVRTRQAAKVASPHNRCYLALDKIDPEWRVAGPRA